MLALLDDVAVADDQDQVSVANGAQAMSDDETGFALHQLVHGFLDEDFSTGVNRAGGFVQNQHRRARQHCPSDRQQLLFAL